ncbi:MAG: sel1 repeat family protein [Treponema sp.]|nr:sel1 repeat family protein [Treponema sp.]
MTEEENTKAEEYINEAKSYFKKNDYTMASLYLEKAVNLGHILAHHLLATHYYKGLGVEKDIDKAIKLFEVSANAGIIESQQNVGALYLQKSDITSSPIEKASAWSSARMWLQKAADQGSTDSMYNLGIYEASYMEDFEEAGKWYEKAARLGHPQALAALKDLCRKGFYYVNM